MIEYIGSNKNIYKYFYRGKWMEKENEKHPQIVQK